MDHEKMCREQLRLNLLQTDEVAAIMDHGKRTEILAWRQLIRDFPETADFPDITKIPEPTWR